MEIVELTGWTKGANVTDATTLHLFLINEKALLISGQYTVNGTTSGNQEIITLPIGMKFSTKVARQDVNLGGINCLAWPGGTTMQSSVALSAGTKYIQNAIMLLD